MAELLPRPFGNPFGGFIGNELMYMGNVLSQGRIPYIAPPSTLKQPKAGTAQETGMYGRYLPGKEQVPFGGTPQERAQAAETSRVAQLTAQDPELQRYEKARASAKTQEEMNAARDIGMQMWAKANPQLAAKVKPGQSGYEAIQGVLNAGQMGEPMDLPFNPQNPLGGTPAPEGLSYGTTAPVAIPGGTPVKGGGFPKGQAAMFERFMQGRSAAAPTFQGSPLGTAPAMGPLNYGGAVQPLGTALADEFYKTDKAKELAAMFANSRFAQ